MKLIMESAALTILIEYVVKNYFPQNIRLLKTGSKNQFCDEKLPIYQLNAHPVLIIIIFPKLK